MGLKFVRWALSVGLGSTLVLGHIPAEAQLSQQDLMNVSFALAHQMGRGYQMQVDCGLDSNLAPQRTAGLFINYMNEEQVQLVMNEYAKGMRQVEKKPCNKEELKRTLKVLIEGTSNYINLAKEHMRPY